jgi:hypothetical protein
VQSRFSELFLNFDSREGKVFGVLGRGSRERSISSFIIDERCLRAAHGGSALEIDDRRS